MAKKNNEELIAKAHFSSLVSSGIPAEEAERTVSRHINDFKRAEIAAYKEETGIVGAVPISDLAEYLTQKYTGNDIADEQIYTLEDFKAEAREKTNQWHLENWWKKHQKRAHKHLSTQAFTELAKDVMILLSEIKGDPPTPEEPPHDAEETPLADSNAGQQVQDDGPEGFKLQLEFTVFCEKEQAVKIGHDVLAMLEKNPMLQGDVTLRRIVE